MPKILWTKEDVLFLENNYPFISTVSIAVALNKTLKATASKAKTLGIKKIVKHYHDTWDEEEEQFLKRYYFEKTAKEIAVLLGKTIASVKNRVHKLSITLPEAEREKRKFLNQFQSGQIPLNKGKKWDDFMSKEAQANARKTTFKKGNLPHNTKFDNAITIRNDKSGTPYQWIRIGLSNWQMLHVFNYTKNYGAVPEGFNVYFKNGDTMNCEPENLGLETRADNMKRNSIHNYPEEIKTTIKLLTKLKRIINGKEQNSRLTEPSV